MNEKRLKGALWSTITLCIVLAAALGYLLIRNSAVASTKASDPGDPVVARGPSLWTARAPASRQDEAKLAPVQLSRERMQEIGVTFAEVQRKTVNQSLHAQGNVAMDERRLVYVQTRFAGWIRDVYANATYQYVKKGQKLFTIYSPELVSTEQEYLLAKKNQAAVSGPMHDGAVQGTAAKESSWLADAVEERLKRFDVPAAELQALQHGGLVKQNLAVESPAAGYIVERNALPNAYVQPETKLYTIADLSSVWVIANVFQTDVGRLRRGDAATVTVDAYPGRKFTGRVDEILPEVDAATRTVKVRLVMSNPGLVLKPGMYVEVDIAAPLGEQLVIPASGVLQAGTRQIAFVDRGEGRLDPREIETGERVGDDFVAQKGLKAGERVVSSANFLVDSEAQLQADFAPSEHATGSTADPEARAGRIEITTTPSPARRGRNTVRVLLTGNGKPVVGAQVAVTFSMAAMPAMGMAGMKAEAALENKGQGVYEGTIELRSGGTWEVTVVATRNGQTFATKTLSMQATGGMS